MCAHLGAENYELTPGRLESRESAVIRGVCGGSRGLPSRGRHPEIAMADAGGRRLLGAENYESTPGRLESRESAVILRRLRRVRTSPSRGRHPEIAMATRGVPASRDEELRINAGGAWNRVNPQ